MKHIAAGLIVLAVAAAGCHRTTGSPAKPAKSAKSTKPAGGKVTVEWFTMPPVPSVNPQDTLIPILTIDGAWYTTCQGMEIPLHKNPEGLTWGLLPSPLAGTTIGYFGPSYPCSIRIVDRTRAAFDQSYSPDTTPPVLMTKAEKPKGLLDAADRKPRKLDDFVGLYYPVWFPWVRMEVRKDGSRYISQEEALAGAKPPLRWMPQGRPQMLTPLADGLGFIGFPGDPHSLAYNETLRRFELVRTDNGIRMPVAKVSPEKKVALPPQPIGIPAWK